VPTLVFSAPVRQSQSPFFFRHTGEAILGRKHNVAAMADDVAFTEAQ
jgi:hypothetical protein